MGRQSSSESEGLRAHLTQASDNSELHFRESVLSFYPIGRTMQGTEVATRTFRLSLTYLWSWGAAAHLLLICIVLGLIAACGRTVNPVEIATLGILPFFY